MGDFQSGYDGLARPGGNDWTAFNAGIAQRQHETAMADMAARHHAASQANFNAMMAPPPTGMAGGGFGGGALTPAGRKAMLWLLLAPLAAWMAYSLVSGVNERMRQSARAARAAEAAELQRQTDAFWQPRLGKAVRAFDPARDLTAIQEARKLSSCYDLVIGELISGLAGNWQHCAGTSRMEDSGPVKASVHYDRFTFGYVTPNPTIRHRATAIPLTRYTLTPRPDLGRESPVTYALEQFGRAAVERYAGRGCIVIAVDRHASNAPFDAASFSEGAAPGPVTYSSVSTVSLACPAGKAGLRLVASRNTTPSWQR